MIIPKKINIEQAIKQLGTNYNIDNLLDLVVGGSLKMYLRHIEWEVVPNLNASDTVHSYLDNFDCSLFVALDDYQIKRKVDIDLLRENLQASLWRPFHKENEYLTLIKQMVSVADIMDFNKHYFNIMPSLRSTPINPNSIYFLGLKSKPSTATDTQDISKIKLEPIVKERINAYKELTKNIKRSMNTNESYLSKGAVFPFKKKIMQTWLNEFKPDLFNKLSEDSFGKFFSDNSLDINKIANMKPGPYSEEDKTNAKIILKHMKKETLIKLL